MCLQKLNCKTNHLDLFSSFWLLSITNLCGLVLIIMQCFGWTQSWFCFKYFSSKLEYFERIFLPMVNKFDPSWFLSILLIYFHRFSTDHVVDLFHLVVSFWGVFKPFLTWNKMICDGDPSNTSFSLLNYCYSNGRWIKALVLQWQCRGIM